MAASMEVKVLTIFILLVNVLMIIFYARNTPRATSKRDQADIVKRVIHTENNIRVEQIDKGRSIKQETELEDTLIDNGKVNKKKLDFDNNRSELDKAYDVYDANGDLDKHDASKADYVKDVKDIYMDNGGDVDVIKAINDSLVIIENGDKDAVSDHEKSAILKAIKQNAELEDIANTNDDFTHVGPGVYIYSAYMDDRKDRFIRLVAVAHVDNHCKLWCKFGQDRYVDAEFYKTCESHRLKYAAYLISCPIPNRVSRSNIRNQGVTVISNSKDKLHTNFKVKVAASSVPFYRFTVCVPPLYGHIPQDKIIEFIEVTRLFGADHFTFYDNGVSENVKKILETYGKNIVEIKPWRHKFSDEELWYKGQSASIWDCLMENMFKSTYVSFNDIDEFIVPRTTDNWNSMLHRLTKNGEADVAGFRFKSVIFDNKLEKLSRPITDDIKHLITMKTVVRTKQGDINRSKLMVNPRKVFELGIHHLSKPLEDRFLTVTVKTDIAVIHHYREFARFPLKKKIGEKPSDRIIEDYTMWRFRHNITKAVEAKLNDLKLIFLR